MITRFFGWLFRKKTYACQMCGRESYSKSKNAIYYLALDDVGKNRMYHANICDDCAEVLALIKSSNKPKK